MSVSLIVALIVSLLLVIRTIWRLSKIQSSSDVFDFSILEMLIVLGFYGLLMAINWLIYFIIN